LRVIFLCIASASLMSALQSVILPGFCSSFIPLTISLKIFSGLALFISARGESGLGFEHLAFPYYICVPPLAHQARAVIFGCTIIPFLLLPACTSALLFPPLLFFSALSPATGWGIKGDVFPLQRCITYAIFLVSGCPSSRVFLAFRNIFLTFPTRDCIPTRSSPHPYVVFLILILIAA